MAIRPVDLQLAYLAAPQNAAQVSAAQNAPQAAQHAAAASFAAQLSQREEQIDEPDRSHGTKVREREERAQQDRPQDNGAGDHADPDRQSNADGPLFAGDGDHFIDVTC